MFHFTSNNILSKSNCLNSNQSQLLSLGTNRILFDTCSLISNRLNYNTFVVERRSPM